MSSTFVGNEKRQIRKQTGLYKALIIDNIDLKIPLKTANNIDQAVQLLTKTLQDAAYHSTPESAGRLKYI